MGEFLNKFKLGFLILLKLILRKWRVISLVTLILTFVVSLIIFTKPFKPTSISEGIVGTYQTHDLPESVTNLLSKSLVSTDENGRMVGNLAEGWDVNSDATVYKFKLRNNIYWSDGARIKSNDIEFSIQDVEVSYPDEATIQFKLKGAFSAFPSLLTKPVFKKDTITGVGPYKIEKIEKSRIFITKITLKKIDPAINTVPDIVVRFYPNEKTALLAFELGEIQSLIGVNSTPLNSSLNKLTKITNYEKIITILYNTKDPALSSRSFRQSLSYSAPEIKDETPAKTPLQPHSWAYTDEVNDYLDNPQSAKAALKRSKNSSSEEIFKKEIVLTATPQLENIGKQVIASWNNLGIKSVLRIESGIPQNFQALLISQSIPVDPDQYSLWHSTQTKTNLTGYSSARIDKDLEDGRKLIMEEERKVKYIDFQKQLLEDSPATFLYFSNYNVIYLKKIETSLSEVLPIQLP